MIELMSDRYSLRFVFMWYGDAHIGCLVDMYGDIFVSMYIGVWDGSVCVDYPGIFSWWGLGDFTRRGSSGAVSGVVSWRCVRLGVYGGPFGKFYSVFDVRGDSVVWEVESVYPNRGLLEICCVVRFWGRYEFSLYREEAIIKL